MNKNQIKISMPSVSTLIIFLDRIQSVNFSREKVLPSTEEVTRHFAPMQRQLKSSMVRH